MGKISIIYDVTMRHCKAKICCDGNKSRVQRCVFLVGHFALAVAQLTQVCKDVRTYNIQGYTRCYSTCSVCACNSSTKQSSISCTKQHNNSCYLVTQCYPILAFAIYIMHMFPFATRLTRNDVFYLPRYSALSVLVHFYHFRISSMIYKKCILYGYIAVPLKSYLYNKKLNCFVTYKVVSAW